MTKWIILLFPSLVLAQPIWLNDDQGVMDREIVNRSLWSVNQRFGTDFTIKDTSHLGCQNDSITIRRASVEEWMVAGWQLIGGITALEHNCPEAPTGYGIVFGPNLLNDRVFTTQILQHELIHALGVKGHPLGESSLMYGGPIKANVITLADMQLVTPLNRWPHGKEDFCFAEVLPNYDFYIPSINGNSAYMTFIEKWKWKAAITPNASPIACEGFSVENGRAVIPSVRMYPDKRWKAVLERSGDVWSLAGLEAL